MRPYHTSEEGLDVELEGPWAPTHHEVQWKWPFSSCTVIAQDRLLVAWNQPSGVLIPNSST